MVNEFSFVDGGIRRSVTIETDDVVFGFHWLTADKVVLAAAQGIADKVGRPVEITGVMNVTVTPESWLAAGKLGP